MTREQKIKNIIDATAAVIEKETQEGTMTVEKYSCIVENMNAAILAVNE